MNQNRAPATEDTLRESHVDLEPDRSEAGNFEEGSRREAPLGISEGVELQATHWGQQWFVVLLPDETLEDFLTWCRQLPPVENTP